MRTIAHVYDTYAEASRVVSQLEAAGVPSDTISLISGEKGAGGSGGTATGATSGDAEQGAATGAGTGATLGTVLGGGAGLLAGLGSLAIPGVGPIVAAGWLVATLTGAGIGAAAGGLAGSLIGAGVSEADAQAYSEGVSRGGTLVTVRADEGMASRIQQIMGLGGAASTGPSVTDTATMHVTSPGMTTAGTGTAATAMGTTTAATTAATTGTTGTDDTIKVVREDLVVGKREVERGGVRVTSHVVETPVQEQVRLHDERVTIERRPVDQPVGNLPADAFQERVIEATAMSEEAIVAKDVRVVEEIAIRKEATERVETVRDTVRETKVDIEDTTSTGTASTTGTTTTTTGTTGATGPGTGTASTTDTAATTGRSNTGTTRDTTGGTSVSGALPRE